MVCHGHCDNDVIIALHGAWCAHHLTWVLGLSDWVQVWVRECLVVFRPWCHCLHCCLQCLEGGGHRGIPSALLGECRGWGCGWGLTWWVSPLLLALPSSLLPGYAVWNSRVVGWWWVVGACKWHAGSQEGLHICPCEARGQGWAKNPKLSIPGSGLGVPCQIVVSIDAARLWVGVNDMLVAGGLCIWQCEGWEFVARFQVCCVN